MGNRRQVVFEPELEQGLHTDIVPYETNNKVVVVHVGLSHPVLNDSSYGTTRSIKIVAYKDGVRVLHQDDVDICPKGITPVTEQHWVPKSNMHSFEVVSLFTAEEIRIPKGAVSV